MKTVDKAPCFCHNNVIQSTQTASLPADQIDGSDEYKDLDTGAQLTDVLMDFCRLATMERSFPHFPFSYE